MGKLMRIITGILLVSTLATNVSAKQAIDQLLLPCPDAWEEYVSSAYNIIKTSQSSNRRIVFSGDDGAVTGCLNPDVPADALREIDIMGRSIAKAAPLMRNHNPLKPLTYCSSSYTSITHLKVMVVQLPYEKAELQSQACQVRMNAILPRISNFLNGTSN